MLIPYIIPYIFSLKYIYICKKKNGTNFRENITENQEEIPRNKMGSKIRLTDEAYGVL